MSLRSNTRSRSVFGVFGRRTSALKCSTRQRRDQLRLETLEDRRLLAVSPGEVWSQKGGDAGHDSYVSTEVNPSTISELWYTPIALAQTPLHRFTERGVAVDGERIYRVALEGRVDSGTGHLYAFDLDTGAQEWTTPFSLYTYDAISEPVVDNGLVYINRGGHSSSSGTPDPTLYALNATTGTIARTRNYAAQWGSNDQPTVDNGQLFVADGYYGGISGYDSTTLNEIWNASGPQLENPESAVNDTYVFAYGSAIYPRGSGTPVQSIRTVTGMTSAQSPMVDEDGNVLYTGGTGSGFVTLVDGNTLEILWETMPTSQQVPTAKAIGGGRVAISVSSGVEFLDQTTGNGLGNWNVPTGYRGPGQVVMTDEVAFVVAPQDYSSTSEYVTWTTFAVDLTTMTTVWTHDQDQPGTYGNVELAVVNDRLITSAWNGIHVFRIGAVAHKDLSETTENTQVVIDVLANDDTDGGSWQISAVADPANGTALIANGQITYTPDTGFIGSDTFTYTIDNGNGGTDTATINVTVAGNLDPAALDDSATTDEDTAITINVLANDTDTEGDVLSVALVTDAAKGTVVVNADGTATYLPDLDFHGNDSFTYTVSDGNGGFATATVEVTVNSVNDDPDAVDDAFSMNEDETLIVSSIAAVDPVLHYHFDESSSGAAPALDSGTIPTADGTFVGLATRTGNTPSGISSGALDLTQGGDANNYVSDNDAQKIDDLTQMTATFWLNLRDDPQAGDVLLSDLTDYPAPEFTTGWELRIAGPTFATAPTADDFRLEFETGQIGTSLANAQAAAKGPYSADGQWAFVAVTFSSTGLFQWYSGSEFAEPTLLGQTTFAYPLSNLNNLVDMRIGGSSETPDVDRTPPAWIDDVRIYDRVLNAAEIDDARLANLSSTGGGVLANDGDVDGNSLSSSLLAGPSHGTLTLNSDGSFEYTPDPDFNGMDRFTYTASDDVGGSSTATVDVTVNPVNDDPSANDDFAVTDEDTPVVIDVLSNDHDGDGDGLTVTLVGVAANGTASINGDGTVTYTPNANFSGSDSFTYAIDDGNGGTATSSIAVEVLAVNKLRVVDLDGTRTMKGKSGKWEALVTATIHDDKNQPVAGAVVNGRWSGATSGTISGTTAADGTVTFATGGMASGDDVTFTVESVSGDLPYDSSENDDADGDSDGTVITVSRTPTNNEPPVASNDWASTPKNAALTVDVLANDSDPNNEPLMVQSVTEPANGSVVINTDSTLTYTPNSDFVGSDSFEYTIRDGGGSTDSATVTVTVQEDSGNVMVHIGDLDARTNIKGKSGKWEAVVTATIHDTADQPVGGVTVVGQWSGAITGSASATTAADGTVVFARGNITSSGGVTFLITGISGGVTYHSAANHDPDGDSDGTSISVNQDGSTNIAMVALSVSQDEERLMFGTTTEEPTVSPGTTGEMKKSADATLPPSRSSRWNIQLVDRIMAERKTGEHPLAGLVDDVVKTLKRNR